MFVELVHNHICIDILAKLNADAHTLSVGFIAQICDAVNLFILHKLCYLFN